MATSTINQDGTLSLILTPDEIETLAGLPTGQFDAYITLWLHEREQGVLSERFAKLTNKDKADVMAILKK
jgi:hypothetical protein